MPSETASGGGSGKSTPTGSPKIQKQEGVAKQQGILNPNDTLNSHPAYQKLSGVLANLELGNARKSSSSPFPLLSFPPLPFLPLFSLLHFSPSLPFPSVHPPSLPLEVGPLKSSCLFGERCKVPAGYGAEPRLFCMSSHLNILHRFSEPTLHYNKMMISVHVKRRLPIFSEVMGPEFAELKTSFLLHTQLNILTQPNRRPCKSSYRRVTNFQNSPIVTHQTVVNRATSLLHCHDV